MSEIDVRGASSSARYFKGAQLSTDMSPGLWEGRQFRAYRQFSAAVLLRFNATKDFILTAQSLSVSAGQGTVQILTSPTTDTGTWAAIGTNVQKNRLSVNTYVQANAVQVGGAITGGTEREILVANAGVGQGNSAANILASPRLLPAGLYYFNITISGTTAGVFSIEWEELG